MGCTSKECGQKEKELAKLKDEVYKTLIGESQYSQSLLSELIQTKEQEVVEIRKKHNEAEERAEALSASLREQRAACLDLTDWVERFDLQEPAEKKTMLINLIKKITIFDEVIDIEYSIDFDRFEENSYNGYVSTLSNRQNQEYASLCSGFAQRDTQARMWEWRIAAH